MTEAQLYQHAGAIIQIAMGREKVSRGRGRKAQPTWLADEDPLAYWCGVEAIVDLAKSFRRNPPPAPISEGKDA